MFTYLFSTAIAFVVFGVTYNILKRVYERELDKLYTKDEQQLLWLLIVLMSIFWFVVIPVSLVCLTVYLLKLLTDKIANIILNSIKNRNLGGKDEH